MLRAIRVVSGAAFWKKIPPALLRSLKGKTCFHLKQLDDGLRRDIEAALEVGTKSYKDRGWL
jgi:hypothetical protein